MRRLLMVTIVWFIMVMGSARGYYKNPVLSSGADPWVVKHEGIYYYCCSKDNGIWVSASKDLHHINLPVKVWSAPEGKKWNSHCIWAPELHYIDGRWYIYYAGGYSGPPFIHQRAGVLQSVGKDPFGEYIDKGSIFTGDTLNDWDHNYWSIDMTVFRYKGDLYAIWSGWDKHEKTDKTQQNLYIARMKNPWTMGSARVKISSPDRDFEKGELPLNEGPEILFHGDDVFLIYSCGQSWLDTYKLAYLKLRKNADPLLPENWLKGEKPIFEGNEGAFGVGHACFTTSPDDTEYYILYHTKKDRTPGWNREVRLQKFTFDENGIPYFGKPEPRNKSLPLPSGTVEE
ncbi:glycoside hydrolase family 43 protein [Coprobacter tertius]|uniref:Glycoside hydrolase family 43 protein n=1 Tax=Coprobacter tertius TaxID=2944915 RepID=A0ABT1MKB6_9BACT|nr:glycoside hydrolase family 43 protein [Coprobacter tertius]MCP9613084.1 glycoside hydrolase family 43 protein [Coprobacter tertius]